MGARVRLQFQTAQASTRRQFGLSQLAAGLGAVTYDNTLGRLRKLRNNKQMGHSQISLYIMLARMTAGAVCIERWSEFYLQIPSPNNEPTVTSCQWSITHIPKKRMRVQEEEEADQRAS